MDQVFVLFTESVFAWQNAASGGLGFQTAVSAAQRRRGERSFKSENPKFPGACRQLYSDGSTLLRKTTRGPRISEARWPPRPETWPGRRGRAHYESRPHATDKVEATAIIQRATSPAARSCPRPSSASCRRRRPAAAPRPSSPCPAIELAGPARASSFAPRRRSF